MRISYFIIGIIICCLFVFSLSIFISDTLKPSTITINQSEIDQYNKFEELNNLTRDIQKRANESKTNRNIADITGGFIADTKDVVTISSTSISTFNSISQGLFDSLGIGVLFKFFVVILLILIFLGVILAIVVGKDEL